MMDDLKPIRVFLETAHQRSFAAAARRLGMTPATVTRTIARLERDLGTQLLVRSTRSVALTADGAAVMARLEGLVAAFDTASAELRATHAPDRGQLRVTAPLSFALRVMPPLLAQFRREWPGVDLQMTLRDRLEDVMEGHHDLAIRISAPPRDKTTIWRRICAVPRAIVAAPGLLLQTGQPQRPEDLDPALCLGYASGDATETWRLSRAGQTRQIAAGPGFVTNNGDLLAELAQDGAGFVLLPEFIVAPALQSGALVRVLHEWQAPQLWLSLTYPAYDRLPPLVARFSEHFEQGLRDVDGLAF
ncbi:MAG: LysR family transcriptional regulator [Roseinatronobacter sp.]